MIPHGLVSTAARASAGFCLALLLAPASPAAALDTKAFTFTSDFQTGSLSVVNLANRAVSLDVASVWLDATLRFHGGLLYVVNRLGGDNIQVIDPTNYATLRQISVGNGTNPQDIAFVSPTKAYVSRYADASLLIVNPSLPDGGPDPKPTISLAGFADSDGLPEMARMIRIGRYLYVACQRLTNFLPNNPSMVVVIDTQTDQVVDVNPNVSGVQAITLTLRNPITTFEYDRLHGWLLIGCAGSFGALDGGVEAIDPSAFTSQGVRVTEAELGGDINDVAWHTPTHAYALIGAGSLNRLVTWNPTNGLKTGTPFTGNGGFSLPDMEINDRGELYVCKNPSPPSGSDLPGILVFSLANDALLAGPLDTGLPPIAVTFDRATDEVTGVPDSPVAAGIALQGPWPNPARRSAHFVLRLDGRAGAEVSVLDVTGRRVRSLVAAARGAGEHAVDWDLANEAGNPVPAGLYFLRVATGSAVESRRIAVAR
jgi:hypothetical protein